MVTSGEIRAGSVREFPRGTTPPVHLPSFPTPRVPHPRLWWPFGPRGPLEIGVKESGLVVTRRVTREGQGLCFCRRTDLGGTVLEDPVRPTRRGRQDTRVGGTNDEWRHGTGAYGFRCVRRTDTETVRPLTPDKRPVSTVPPVCYDPCQLGDG